MSRGESYSWLKISKYFCTKTCLYGKVHFNLHYDRCINTSVYTFSYVNSYGGLILFIAFSSHFNIFALSRTLFCAIRSGFELYMSMLNFVFVIQFFCALDFVFINPHYYFTFWTYLLSFNGKDPSHRVQKCSQIARPNIYYYV